MGEKTRFLRFLIPAPLLPPLTSSLAQVLIEMDLHTTNVRPVQDCAKDKGKEMVGKLNNSKRRKKGKKKEGQ